MLLAVAFLAAARRRRSALVEPTATARPDVAGGSVMVRGCPIFARRLGADRPDRLPVVLVHGVVVSGRYMVPLMRALAGTFAVHAPDLPGYGRSGKPVRYLDVPGLAGALRDWLRAAGIPRAHLVANSFGCRIAVELAARHPELVGGVVLQGPTADRAARSLPRQALRTLRDGGLEPLELQWIWLLDYARVGFSRALWTMRLAVFDGIERRLPLVRAPALVVRGTLDGIVPQRWAEEVAGLLPQGRLAVVPGGAHTLNFTAPEALAGLAAPFLLEVERRMGRP